VVRAGVAQLVEHLICNQRVGGSNPFASSRYGTKNGFWNKKFSPAYWGLVSAGPVLRGDPTEVHAPNFRIIPGGA
jgi:hypothetical protein